MVNFILFKKYQGITQCAEATISLNLMAVGGRVVGKGAGATCPPHYVTY